jgi:hypothetical protein
MSMLPFFWRTAMSNVLSKNSRCVVSACVSITIGAVVKLFRARRDARRPARTAWRRAREDQEGAGEARRARDAFSCASSYQAAAA